MTLSTSKKGFITCSSIGLKSKLLPRRETKRMALPKRRPRRRMSVNMLMSRRIMTKKRRRRGIS